MNESENTLINATGSKRPMTAISDDFVASLSVAQIALTPVLVVVGLAGNILTVLVVRERRFKQMNCTIMLLGLAISDTLMLLTTSLNQVFMSSLPVDVRALSPIGCKLFFIVYRTAKVTSSWIVVLIAVERFFAVVFPLRFKTAMCRRNVLIMMAVIYTVTIGYNILWSTMTKIIKGVCYASVTTAENETLGFVLVLLRGIQYSFIPIGILVCVTPPIIYTLIVNQVKRGRMIAASNAGRSIKEISRTTTMLILVIVLHVVGSMPFTILFVRNVFYGESIFKSSSREYLMFFLVSPTLEQINHSSNFFIYILFSPTFRKRVTEIMRCRPINSEVMDNGTNGISSTIRTIS